MAVCPKCKDGRLDVLDSRDVPLRKKTRKAVPNALVYRKRRCTKCRYLLHTVEVPAEDLRNAKEYKTLKLIIQYAESLLKPAP